MTAYAIILAGNTTAVTAFETIKVAKHFADGQGNGNLVASKPEDLERLSGPQLVSMFGNLTGKPVNKFADRKTALRRVWGALNELVSSGTLPVVEAATDDEVKAHAGAQVKKAGKSQPTAKSGAAKKARTKVTKVAFGDAAVIASGVVGEFGVGEGTNRATLVTYMHKHIGKYSPISDLMKAVYGEARKDYKGQLMMVMKGLRMVIDANDLPYEIKKIRENKENAFGLFPTS